MATTIDSLEIEIQATSQEAVARLNALAVAMERLRSATNGLRLGSVANNLARIRDAVNGINSNRVSVLRDLSTTLSGLSSIQRSTGLQPTVNALRQLSRIDLSGFSASGIQDVAQGLSALGSVRATGFVSGINALRRVPQLTQDLDTATLDRFSRQIQQVTDAMEPLNSRLQQITGNFGRLNPLVNQTINTNNRLENSYNSLDNTLGRTATSMRNWVLAVLSGRQIFNYIKQAITESNDYVENLNLFTVAMGDVAEEALEYAETVKNALGIDPSEWIRNQGVFKQVTSGFGVVEDKANLMSKNLTQLGYDISSFFNISVEDAMQKLQSGISGELEPLRSLGYALDVATLQQVAYDNGITKSIYTMTQAEKAQLRYLAIMEQSGNALGDMAATVQTPANALRILQQEFTQLSRAVGNLFIPALQRIIPVVRVVVEVITEAVQALANLFGFELPTIDYSGLDGMKTSIEGVDSGFEDATSAAKEFKKQLLGIDELNIIEPQAASGSAGGGALGSTDLGLDLPEYDFLSRLAQSTDELKGKFEDLLPKAAGLSAILAGLGVSNLIKSLGDALTKINNLQKVAAGLVIAGIEFKVNEWSIGKYLDTGNSGYLLLDLVSTALGSYLLYKAFGPAGIVLGVGVGVVANITSLSTKLASGSLSVNDPKTWIVAALTTAMGGIGGAIGLSSLGFTIGQGLIVGLSLTAAFTLTGINFGAIASGQYDSGSVRSILLSALSTLFSTIGGSVLGSVILGPAGAVIGLSVGLLVNIVSVKLAENQHIKDVVFDTFLSGNDGEFTLTDIQVSFDELSKSISGSFDTIVEHGKEIDTVQDSIKNTISNVTGLVNQVAVGAVDIDTNISSIIESFERLKTDSAQIFEEERQIIITGLGGSIGEVAAAIGVDLPAVSALISSLASAGTEEAQRLTSELSNLSQSYASGMIEAEQYYGKYYDLMSDFQNLMGDTSVIDDYAKSVNDWKNSMNFSDIVDGTSINIGKLQDVLGGFETSYTSSVTSINQGTDDFKAAINDLVRAGQAAGVELSDTQLKEISNTLLGAETDRAQQIANMQGYYGQILDAVQNNLINGLGDQVKALQQDYANKSPIYKFFHSEADYVKQGLQTYQQDVVNPILAEIQSSMTRIGIDGEPWANEAITKVMGAIFTYDVNETGSMKAMLTGNTSDAIADVMANTRTITLPYATQTGENLANGILAGATSMLNASKHTWLNWAFLPAQWFAEANQIHSPSKIFAGLGENLSDGLWEGIKNRQSSLFGNLRSWIDGIINQVDTRLTAKTSSTKSYAGSSISKPRQLSRSVASVAYESAQSIEIPAYAGGGFPSAGQLFIANEAGPELVGEIGGRTVVANNDQIVSGIADGVRDANEEVINAIYAIAQQLIAAIRENGDKAVYLDNRRVSAAVSDMQSRHNLMYGR